MFIIALHLFLSFAFLVWWMIVGMTPPWALVTIVLGIGARWWHRRQQPNGFGRKRVFYGVVGLATAVITIGRYYTFAAPSIPAWMSEPAQTAYLDEPLTFDNYDIELVGDDDEPLYEFVVFESSSTDGEIDLDIDFPPINGFSEMWYLSAPSITATCNGDCDTEPFTQSSMADSPSQDDPHDIGDDLSFTPRLELDDYPLDRLTLNRWHDVVVTATVVIQRENGDVIREPVKREFRMYVGTAEEREVRILMNRYRELNTAVESSFPNAIGILASGVVSTLVLMWGYRAERTYLRTSIAARHTKDINTRPLEPDQNGVTVPPTGVRVTMVKADSVWYDAGVQSGDVLLELNGEVLPTQAILREKLRGVGGDSARLTLYRDGTVFDVQLMFSERSKRTAAAKRDKR
jgi:hypothetical protein